MKFRTYNKEWGSLLMTPILGIDIQTYFSIINFFVCPSEFLTK